MDVYTDLGVEPVINAAGTLTRLSGSAMLPEVSDAMAAASRRFVDMEELHVAAGKRVASLIGVEAAHVCACATAGIAVMAAACMAGVDRKKINQLPDTKGLKYKFIAHRAHRNSFDQALQIAGGRFVEIGANAAELYKALEDGEVAAVFYTFSWFCTEDCLTLSQVAELARERGVPVIVDAAAEVPPVENLTRFIGEGADLVTFSGGKAMRGPQASGIILGRTDLIEACAANDSPNMSIGRGMKAGKEEIVGCVKAVELYVKRDHAAELAVWEGRVAHVISALEDIDGVEVWRQMPYGIGQHIPHVAVRWDEDELGATHQEVAARLKNGQPRIAVQWIHQSRYRFADEAGPQLRVHAHTLFEGEEVVVGQKFRELLAGINNS